jgi:transcriptional regulator with XRE-family HTH domain
MGAFTFGALLRHYRLTAGLSQEELAEAAHISTAAVGAYERGVRLAPHRISLARLADALGLTDTERTQFMMSAQRKLGPRPRRVYTAVVELWRRLLETQSDEQFNGTAQTAIELLDCIDDTAELALCWTLLADRLDRGGQHERAHAARNCARALSGESATATTRASSVVN